MLIWCQIVNGTIFCDDIDYNSASCFYNCKHLLNSLLCVRHHAKVIYISFHSVLMTAAWCGYYSYSSFTNEKLRPRNVTEPAQDPEATELWSCDLLSHSKTQCLYCFFPVSLWHVSVTHLFCFKLVVVVWDLGMPVTLKSSYWQNP